MGSKEIVARNVVLNYQAVIGPRVFADGGKSYSTLIMISKSDEALLQEISRKIDDVIFEESAPGCKFENLSNEMKEQIAVETLHDADIEENEAMAGYFYMRVSTKSKPKVIDSSGNDLTGIDDVYNGVIASVVFRLYAYTYTDKKASEMKYKIGGELIGVVKMAEGKRITNAISTALLLDKVLNEPAKTTNKATNKNVDDDDGYVNPFTDGDTNER